MRKVPYLRDVATICPAVSKLSSGLVINRCELDLGHKDKHKDGCTRWGNPVGAQPDTGEDGDGCG